MEEQIRLQKYLAEAGVASRRKCEEYIIQGKIRVNNEIVTTLGTKINPKIDIVYYNNELISLKENKYYILLNKPIGYVTTAKDQYNRDTVLDLIKGIDVRLVPVGRLDMYTSGALILTNDGKFVYHITHPKHEVKKTYNVTLRGVVTKQEISTLESGVKIENYVTKPAKVTVLKIDKDKCISRLEITIHEGKNRQVRKMCEQIDKKVIALHRSKIGDLSVKDMEIGTWRYLKKEEINKLYLHS